MFQDVLTFWFEELGPKMWWSADADLDGKIKARFQSILHEAMRGELFPWRKDPLGRLAEIIVLDQFSRHVYRNSPLAFAQDPMALVLSQEAIGAGADKEMSPVDRSFLYMPFMHSESKAIHQWAEKLYSENGLKDNYDFELRHKAIIDRFGRYPHRNAILGRASSEEEIEFLKQPGSRF